MRLSSLLLGGRHYSHLVTTPIYYANAAPHIGHVYTSVIADAEKRFRRLLLNPDAEQEVFLSTGTDEHGMKIQRAAEKEGVAPREFCDRISAKYRAASSLFGIDHDDFVRTSEERHKEVVRRLWNRIAERGHIEKAMYSGWYSVQDETFVKESQIEERVDGAGNVVARVSAESGHVLEWTEEENYVFKLSRFRERIDEWLSGGVVRPSHFRNHLQKLLAQDGEMADLSVSRPSSRQHWGIPVPGDSTQVIYVWLDALANYLTVAGWEEAGEGEGAEARFSKTWPPDVQVIGKDILAFHAVYWPAFLMAADIGPLPRRIQCHSHWMVEGEKMSKSKGNVVCPLEAADRFTAEGLRFFLLRESVPHSDGNFSVSAVVNVLNNELANTLGNLLNRCTGRAINGAQVYPGRGEDEEFYASCSPLATSILLSLESLADKVRPHFEECHHAHGVDEIMEVLRRTNEFVQEEKPWELKKGNSDKDIERLRTVLHVTMESLRVCGILLQPIVPDLSGRLLDKLAVRGSERAWAHARPVGRRSEDVPLSDEHVVLFRKIKIQD